MRTQIINLTKKVIDLTVALPGTARVPSERIRKRNFIAGDILNEVN